MEYRILGSAELRVSEICLGTMQFRWTTDEPTSYAVLDSFFEQGGTFIDTADIYSKWAPGLKGGEAETVIGNWLKRRGNRHDVVLATKVRGQMWLGPDGEGLGRPHIVRAVEDSLRRLQTDFIDLYQTHHPDEGTPIEETLRALEDLVRHGKVRHIGCSNYSGDKLAEAIQTSQRYELAQFATLQPHYSLVNRREFEEDAYPTAKIYGLAIIPYSPLGRGFLTGKYQRGEPPPDSVRLGSVQRLFTNENWLLLDRLERIAKGRRKTPAQVALAWLLGREQVVSVIIGANTPAQLQDSMGASGWQLTEAETAELDAYSAHA